MEVKTVGVYGAGLMGRGIAQVALEGGYDVVLYNHRTPTLEKGVAGIKKGFEMERATQLVDIVPTICYMMGIPYPTTCEGAVLYQAMEDPDAYTVK